MKINQIRCDVCSRELFYEDSANKVDNFRSVITLSGEITGDKGKINGEKHYCSEECFLVDLQETAFGKPTDILEKLAEYKGYKLVKYEEVENKTGEQTPKKDK